MKAGLNVSIRQLRAFLAVAELNSFTRAAERLHVAQPVLSLHVRELEAELNLRLFDRTTRRVELTEGGREFRNAAALILNSLETAVQNAHDLAERKRGRIVIAAPPLLSEVMLPPAIAEFSERHPAVEIVLADVRTDSIVELVRSGQADCGLGTFAPSVEGITRTIVARDSLMLFCGQASDRLFRDQVAWKDLEGNRFVTLTRDSGIRALVELGFETVELPFKPTYEVSHVTTALGFVEAGLGIAVLPTYARAVARYRKVIAKPLVAPSISRDIVVIGAEGRSVSPAVTAFIPVLRRHARALVPLEVVGPEGE